MFHASLRLRASAGEKNDSLGGAEEKQSLLRALVPLCDKFLPRITRKQGEGIVSHKDTEITKGDGKRETVHLSAVFAQAGEFHELTRKRETLKDGIVNFILRPAK